MDVNNTGLDLRSFYPQEYFDVTDCSEKNGRVIVSLRSKRHSCECPRCHTVSSTYHGTYKRMVQDLPIVGSNVTVEITAHEFACINEDCDVKTIVERFDDFIGYYGRFTYRCEDFITSLSLATSCEEASRILQECGVQISGDTIIRILKKRFSQMDKTTVGNCIGIDDFSTKKGNSYCTIVCDADSRKPVAVLNGRDGTALKTWLQNNKHVKAVTRDRASVYARVIQEELPEAIQIADRFHLHQNLLDIVKKCIASNLPQTIRINTDNMPEDGSSNNDVADQNTRSLKDLGKKNATCCG